MAGPRRPQTVDKIERFSDLADITHDFLPYAVGSVWDYETEDMALVFATKVTVEAGTRWESSSSLTDRAGSP